MKSKPRDVMATVGGRSLLAAILVLSIAGPPIHASDDSAAPRVNVRLGPFADPAAAGGRLGREWPRLERRLRASGYEVTPVHTRAPGHATELAERMVREGIERLVVAGGDGTVCEAAEGVPELLSDRLRWIVLYHLSRTNNLPVLAAEAVLEALDREGSATRICVSEQGEPSSWLDLARPHAAAGAPRALDS